MQLGSVLTSGVRLAVSCDHRPFCKELRMSAFHDQFESDPETDGETLVWRTEKPLLRKSVVEYAPPYPDYPKLQLGRTCQASGDPSCPSAREVDGRVLVTLHCNNDIGFCEFHEIAWDFIVSNASEIEANLRRKLTAQHYKALKQFLEEDLPHDRKTQSYWEKIRAEIDWNDSSAVDHLYKLVAIGLVDNGLDQCGFSSFEFQSGWDRDHGVSIIMHRNRVLAAGGMQEYIFRGPELIECIKYVQSYDLDDGDFVLIEI